MSGPTCPCGAATAGDCEVCEHYRCPRCERWIAWGEGTGDEIAALCDECWGAIEAAGDLAALGPQPTEACS